MGYHVVFAAVLLSGVAAFAPTTSDSWKWPVWPSECEMVGSTWGVFPFWCDTSNSTKGDYKFTCLDRTVTVQHPTRVLYSESRMSQVSYREGCDLTHFGGEKNVTCAHRFMPNGKAYVTYGDRDTGYCCQSFGHLPQTNPLPIPHPDFMNTCLNKQGPMPFNGTYYQGMVYNYSDVFEELPTYFWYLTAADDERPIAQGEGCVADRDRAADCTAAGKTSGLGPIKGDPAFTQLEYDTFSEQTWFADDEFSLPKSCTGDLLRECYNMECDGVESLDPTFRLQGTPALRSMKAL